VWNGKLAHVVLRNRRASVAAVGIALVGVLAVVPPSGATPARPRTANAHLYWSEPVTSRGPSGTGINNIWRAKVNGGSVDKSFVSGLQIPGAVAVSSSHVYWSDDEAGTIGRARTDGTHVQRSLITANADALATAGGFLYWTTSSFSGTPAAIWRSRPDGTHKRKLASIGQGTYIGGLAVNGSRICWTNRDRGTIGRAHLDGTHINQHFVTGLTDPTGLAMSSRNLFWANTVPETSDSIGRARLDGTHVNPNFITGASYPYGVAVGRGYLYWANYNSGTIGRANLDGTQVHQSFISAHTFYNAAEPQYVAVGP
jgi:hypothetical protein